MIDKAFWKGKKVFLTGHTGFKGSWLSIWLTELGAEVCGYALEPNTQPSLFNLAKIDKHITSIIGDIRNLAFLKETMQNFNPDIVIHMAAQPLVKESYDNPVDTYSINVMGTVNLLESVRHCPSVKAVINITTDKVYENKEWIWGYRETDPLEGYDPYSNSKACSELVTSSYINSFFNKDKYDEHGVAIATARAGNVIGGGDWSKDRLIPDILRASENGSVLEIRNIYAVRPWQHVLEPLSGYLILAEKLYLEGTKWNGAWNFGPENSEEKNVEWVINYLNARMQQKINFITLNSNEYHETQMLNLDSMKSKFYLKWNNKWSTEKVLEKILEWSESKNSGREIYEICTTQINEYHGI